MSKALRAVVAARLSLATDESVSIERQTATGEAYCAAKGWPVVGHVADSDVSATKTTPFERPSLRSWIDRADEWDVLVFWKLDRMIRRPSDLADMIRWCQEHGKSLVFTEDGFDLSTPMGEAMAYIAAVFARIEAANTSARVTAAKATIRQTMRHDGAVPYCYVSVEAPDGRGKTLDTDPDAVKIVREIYHRLTDDSAVESLSAVAWDLNSRGIPVPKDHSRLRNGDPSRNGKWDPSSLRKMLQEEWLLGYKIHNGRPVLGADGMPIRVADPVFNDAEWKRLQAALAFRSRGAGVPRKSVSPYVGVLLCKCGANLYRRNADQKNDAYTCQAAKHRKGEVMTADGPMPNPGVYQTEHVHKALETYLLSVFGALPKTRRVFVPGEDHTAELERVNAAVKRLRDDRDAGDYDGEEDEYRSRLDALRESRARLEALPQRPDQWVIEETGQSWAQWWHGADVEERRAELIRAGVRVFYFRPVRTAPGDTNVEFGILADPTIAERLADPSSAVTAAVRPVPPLT
jgi:DNA invertase Pin-like site-specific DNA recombinase